MDTYEEINKCYSKLLSYVLLFIKEIVQNLIMNCMVIFWQTFSKGSILKDEM